jgi:hypothetical protein
MNQHMRPQPSFVCQGSLDMTLRDLLLHMAEHKLNHVVIHLPGCSLGVAVTIATKAQVDELTQVAERICQQRPAS